MLEVVLGSSAEMVVVVEIVGGREKERSKMRETDRT